MPVMSGYEATKRIRGFATDEQQPVIIAVTASVLEKKQVTVMAVGCDDIVIKPFQESDIFEMLKKHLAVKFVYADEEMSATGESPVRKSNLKNETLNLTTATFDTLPKELVAKLKQSVAALEMDTVLEVIEEISVENQPLAEALKGFAEEYRFDKLQKLLDKS